MSRRRRVLAGIAAIGVLAGVGWWWLRDGGPATGGDTHGPGGGRAGAGRLERHSTPGSPRWLGQPGVALRRVAGRVAYGGAPVAGATIHLELAGQLRRVVPPIEIKSGTDGTFDFGLQVATDLLVTANAPGRALAGIQVDLRDPTLNPPPDRLELALVDCVHTVFGVVHDHGGPIVGASVRAAADRAALALATTSDDGRYELCLAQDGGRLAVEADGYARAEVDIAGGRRMRRDVELSPEATLTGIVLGPGDQPVSGALVAARISDMTPFGARDTAGTSDGAGRFAIGGLSPGRYALSASDAGLATGDQVDAVAQVGESDDVTLRLEPVGMVHGRIVEDDQPVAGAKVSRLPNGPMGGMRSFFSAVEAVSQPDGSFTLDGVPPGPFRIDVHDYEVLEPTAPTATMPTTELLVKVASKARILGRVTREGKPVVGAWVNVSGTDRSFGRAAQTTADGAFEVAGLAAGTYEIGAQSQAAFARKAAVTVAKGQRLTGVDIELDLAGEVSGVVVDQRGNPVSGVAVTLEMGPGVDWGHATTDEDGTFVAGAMSGGGEYAITVRPSGSSPLQFAPAGGGEFPKVALTDGRSRATVRIAIQVDRKQISGMVVHQGGKPAADTRVSAFAPDENDDRGMLRWSPPAASATTSADGSFRLEGLLAGSYTVQAAGAIGLEVIEKNVVAGRSNLQLTLPATGTIEGELVGFGDRARVIANPMKSMAPLRGRVERNRFTFRGVPPGPYLVSAQDGARSDEQMVEVAGGKTVTVKLASEGTATVSGRAIDLVTRSPMAGIECASSGSWRGGEGSVTTDRDGRFEIEVPARRQAHVGCFGRDIGIRGWGSAEVKLEPGARAQVVVEVVVQRRVEGAFGDVGFDLAHDKPPRVDKVNPGGPGERAGVTAGDAVLKVDGFAVAALEPSTVFILMLDHKVGEKVELVLGRGGQEVSASVEVVARERGRGR